MESNQLPIQLELFSDASKPMLFGDIFSFIKEVCPNSIDIKFIQKNTKREIYSITVPVLERSATVNNANAFINDNLEEFELVSVAAPRKLKTFTFKVKKTNQIYEIRTKKVGKASNISIHELMTAALVFVPDLGNKIPNSGEEMDLLIDSIRDIIRDKKIIDYSLEEIALLDNDYNNLLPAISAAISIRNSIRIHFKSEPDVAYMTGKTWNKDILKFKKTVCEMKDYNSSDIVFRKDDMFFGVSLKKKENPNDSDPTLLGKSFVTMFDVKNNSSHADLVNYMESSKEDFYSSLVEDAMLDGIINVTSFDKKEWKEYLGTIEPSYILSKLKSEKTFFKDIYDIIDAEKEMLAHYLPDLVLKLSLIDLEKDNFKFAVVTGIGRNIKKGPIVEKAEIFELSDIVANFKTLVSSGAIELISNPNQKQSFEPEGNSAGLFYIITINSLPILDIRLRYKSSFAGQPTIFGFMTKEFKHYLNAEKNEDNRKFHGKL